MKQRNNRNYFTLVEIVLALGVIAIGVTSAMGLFPIGIQASREATELTYVSESAAVVGDFLEAEFLRIQKEVENEKVYHNPQRFDGTSDRCAHETVIRTEMMASFEDLFFMMDTNDSRDLDSKADVSFLPTPPKLTSEPMDYDLSSSSDWIEMVSPWKNAAIYQKANHSEFQPPAEYSHLKSKGPEKAVYRIQFKTPTGKGDQTVTDFDCIVMAGLGEYESRFLDGSWAQTTSKRSRVPGPRLAMVVYWPATARKGSQKMMSFSRRLKTDSPFVYLRRASKGRSGDMVK